MGEMMRKIREAIEEAVFPSNIYCIGCGSLIDSSRPYGLCDGCIEKFHWINDRVCDKCGKALQETYRGRLCYDCMGRQHYFTKGFSCLTYGLYERRVLLDYKYNGKGYLSRKLGDMLYDRISVENLHVDAIIPVPIGKGRSRDRGFNQSALMCRRLSYLWGVPCREELLVRQKETPLLRSLNPAEREMALHGAFAIKEAKRRKSPVVPRPLEGQNLLLVDDIYTTGATADACSRVLLEAGAANVYLLTLASGGNRRPQEE